MLVALTRELVLLDRQHYAFDPFFTVEKGLKAEAPSHEQVADRRRADCGHHVFIFLSFLKE